jgi:hypothetical protein
MSPNPQPDTPLFYHDTTSPQFEEIPKATQAAKVLKIQIKMREDWVNQLSRTREQCMADIPYERIKILINEAQRLDYEYLQCVVEGIRDNVAYEDFLVGWRVKWKEINDIILKIFKTRGHVEAMRHLTTMRLFLTQLQRPKGLHDDSERKRTLRMRKIVIQLRRSGRCFL